MPQPNQQFIYRDGVKPPSNGIAVAALVLGIVAIVPGVLIPTPLVGFVALFLAFLPALLALIFGFVGFGRSREISGAGRGTALAGIILGGVTLAIGIVTVVVWAIAAASTASGS